MLTDETLSHWITSAAVAPGTIGRMAPELLNGVQTTLTKETDVYALAMTIVVSIFPIEDQLISINAYIGNVLA